MFIRNSMVDRPFQCLTKDTQDARSMKGQHTILIYKNKQDAQVCGSYKGPIVGKSDREND